MRVRFEEAGKLVDEVVFPHAELPIGDSVLIAIGRDRKRFAVLSVSMLAECGELKVIVEVRAAENVKAATS